MKSAKSRHWITSLCLSVAVALPVLGAANAYAANDFKLKKGAKGRLCVECHDGFADVMKMPFIHTPLAKGECSSCMWGCRMAVEMIIDQWKPSVKRYRYETFCYGPKSCPLYKAGPTRKVPGRKGMTWEEEDWVDEDAVSHRGMDD